MKASGVWTIVKGTALPICFILAMMSVVSQVVSRTGIFSVNPAQAVTEVVRTNGEELVLTGVFKIVKIMPNKLTLINTDSKNPSAYEVMCPTSIFYELGDLVTARVTFEYGSNQQYRLTNIQIK